MKKALKITGKILLGILIFLVSAIIILLAARLIGRAANGRTPEGGINESMLVDINGTKQWINIYGQDKDNPVLLYLHGGPGSATGGIRRRSFSSTGAFISANGSSRMCRTSKP